MFIENVAEKKALRRGKAIGFYHKEHGKTLNDEALVDFAHVESFAFAHTSRFYSHWATTIRPIYERSFVLAYSLIVNRD